MQVDGKRMPMTNPVACSSFFISSRLGERCSGLLIFQFDLVHSYCGDMFSHFGNPTRRYEVGLIIPCSAQGWIQSGYSGIVITCFRSCHKSNSRGLYKSLNPVIIYYLSFCAQQHVLFPPLFPCLPLPIFSLSQTAPGVEGALESLLPWSSQSAWGLRLSLGQQW